MRRFVVLVVLLWSVAPSHSVRAKAECLDVPPGLTARIEDGMKYVDNWLQGVRAVETREYPGVWFVSADIGGPKYNNHGDIASWAVTSLDPALAEIYRIDEGHADYLSDYPDSEEAAGIKVGILTDRIGDALNCAQDAAEHAGGLGLDRQTWDDRHGATKRTKDGFATKGGSIRFHAEDDRVVGISYSLKAHLTVSEAQALSFELLPADSVRAESTTDGMATENPNLYTSGWLADRLKGKTDWGGADAGTFTVSFEIDAIDGLVSTVSLRPGTA